MHLSKLIESVPNKFSLISILLAWYHCRSFYVVADTDTCSKNTSKMIIDKALAELFHEYLKPSTYLFESALSSVAEQVFKTNSQKPPPADS